MLLRYASIRVFIQHPHNVVTVITTVALYSAPGPFVRLSLVCKLLLENKSRAKKAGVKCTSVKVKRSKVKVKISTYLCPSLSLSLSLSLCVCVCVCVCVLCLLYFHYCLLLCLLLCFSLYLSFTNTQREWRRKFKFSCPSRSSVLALSRVCGTSGFYSLSELGSWAWRMTYVIDGGLSSLSGRCERQRAWRDALLTLPWSWRCCSSLSCEGRRSSTQTATKNRRPETGWRSTIAWPSSGTSHLSAPAGTSTLTSPRRITNAWLVRQPVVGRCMRE